VPENLRSPTAPLSQAIGLSIAVLICYAAVGLGAIVTKPQVPGCYAALAKPTWNPSDWIFGPVWTLLYSMMGFAAWLVWRQAGFVAAKRPLTLFAIQLALNGSVVGAVLRIPKPR
jgi:benzodiazapine receptor